MMYKKLSKYVADKCDSKIFHPINDVKDVDRFKPLCIVEKKKHLGFWKKASMNPTSLGLNDLLVTKDFDISVNNTDYAVPVEDGGETMTKLGASFANKVASENELEYGSGDKMNLVFNLILEKNEIPFEEILAALQDNPLDESHPLYSYAKTPKNPLCLVVETIVTKGQPASENEQVISLVAEGETSTNSTITTDIFSKGSTEKKSSNTYQITPGTVLAYKCIEFKVESNGTVTLLEGIPLNVDECKDTPEHSPQPDTTSETKETEEENIVETEAMDAEISQTNGDEDSQSVDDEIIDEDLEVPIIIRDIHQEEPIALIKSELEPLLQLGYFGKLQAEIKTLIANASEKDFQLIYLLLYRASLYIANNTGDKFMTLAALEQLIGDETKFTWKTVMNRIGFSVPKDPNDPNACVRFPKKDDRGALQALMGVIGSILNVDVDTRKQLINISLDHMKIIHNIIEMQLQNISTFLSDPIVDGMAQKDPLTIDFLTTCGFTKSPDDENMLTYTKENLYMLLDIYALLSVLCAGKKPFLKNSPSFSKEKKRGSLLPRMSSFRRQKSIETQSSVEPASNEDRISIADEEKKSGEAGEAASEESAKKTSEQENIPTTEL